MENYHVGDTGPVIDFLLKRDGEIVDPTDATSVTAQVRIRGAVVSVTPTLAVITDDDGNKRARLTWLAGNLAAAGVYQILVKITWADSVETAPGAHEIRVSEAWV